MGFIQQGLDATPIQADNKTPIDVFHLFRTFYGLSITTATVPGVCECTGVHSAAVQRSLLYPVFVKDFSS